MNLRTVAFRSSALYRAGMLVAAMSGAAALSGCPIVTNCPPGSTDPACRVTCLPGDTRPQCVTAGGSLNITWTINGQPASTACGPANAVNVAISVDNAAPTNVPCANGTFALPNVTVGSHTVSANLLDGANASLNMFPPATVNVIAGTPTTLSVNFTPGGGGGGMVGSVSLAWTVGGMPAATACPANSQVKVESTNAPAGAQPLNRDFGCSQGTAQIDNLPVGAYTLKLTLNGGATPAPVLDNVMATVNQGQTSMVSGLDFPSGGGGGQTGTATLTWAVQNGAMAASSCPANSTVSVAVSGGPTAVSPNPTAPCDQTAGITIPNLAAGSYTFALTLTDPANAANVTTPVEAAGVGITAGQTASVGPLNIICTFCP